MNLLNVQSEIAPLKRVLLHEPGEELENLTPKWLNELLFDDIPWLPMAIKEHQEFARVLRENGVEVLYLDDLVTETISTSIDIKNNFIKQFIKEANITSETLSKVVYDYLISYTDPKKMVRKMMAGIKKQDLPKYYKRTLSDYIKDYPFVTDPMPNLYFTRDPFTIIGNGVTLNKMFTTVRNRETIFGEYIFKYHPVYKNDVTFYFERYSDVNIEGGDILVLNQNTIAVGISQRTHPAAVERLAKKIFNSGNNSFTTVLAFDIPKSRSFMHLDTVFTQVDYFKFAVHPSCIDFLKVYEVIKDDKRKGKLIVTPLEDNLENILSKYLGGKVTLIPCGGGDLISSDREQWSDGANTLAIAPGKVICYQRNEATNKALEEAGITVYTISSSELSRGRGGPRCMSMPFFRSN